MSAYLLGAFNGAFQTKQPKLSDGSKVFAGTLTSARLARKWPSRDHDLECFHRVDEPNENAAWFEVALD